MTHPRGLSAEGSVQAGFTLAEVLIAVAIFAIASAMSVALVSAAVPSIRTDGEVHRLMGMLQVARETAVTRQRGVAVRFDEANSAILFVLLDDGIEVPMQEIRFEYNIRLLKLEGTGNMPEGFGSSGAVDFGGAAALMFVPDGSFRDDADMPVNGTIFLGVAGKPITARAITITGTTARPRSYAWKPAVGSSPGAWVEK